MPQSESTLHDSATPTAPERGRAASITPLFPLILLETLRDRDRPEEVLEDEDVSVSLPRRLGLSDVVMVQIRRFQEERLEPRGRRRRLTNPA